MLGIFACAKLHLAAWRQNTFFFSNSIVDSNQQALDSISWHPASVRKSGRSSMGSKQKQQTAPILYESAKHKPETRTERAHLTIRSCISMHLNRPHLPKVFRVYEHPDDRQEIVWKWLLNNTEPVVYTCFKISTSTKKSFSRFFNIAINHL